MPSSVGSSLLILGAVLTSVSAVAGSAVAGAGALWEALIFLRMGLDRDPQPSPQSDLPRPL